MCVCVCVCANVGKDQVALYCGCVDVFGGVRVHVHPLVVVALWWSKQTNILVNRNRKENKNEEIRNFAHRWS